MPRRHAPRSLGGPAPRVRADLPTARVTQQSRHHARSSKASTSQGTISLTSQPTAARLPCGRRTLTISTSFREFDFRHENRGRRISRNSAIAVGGAGNRKTNVSGKDLRVASRRRWPRHAGVRGPLRCAVIRAAHCSLLGVGPGIREYRYSAECLSRNSDASRASRLGPGHSP